jgi:hypothetical protein
VDVKGAPAGWERFEVEGVIGAKKPGWGYILADERLGVPERFAGPGLAMLDAEGVDYTHQFALKRRQRLLLFITDPSSASFSFIAIQPCVASTTLLGPNEDFRRFIEDGEDMTQIGETTYTGLRSPLYDMGSVDEEAYYGVMARNGNCLLLIEYYNAVQRAEALDELDTFSSMLKAPPNP